jgi:hypothetical protein
LKDASGIPGALSNTPPPAPTTNANTTATPTSAAGDKSTSTSRSTRNFELDRSVRHVKAASGTVERLSVAVVINERGPLTKNEKGEPMDPKPNPYTEDEITRMQSLVRGVVGFNEARGDVVTVIQAKFEPEQVYDMSVPWYKDESVVNNLKTGLLGLIVVCGVHHDGDPPCSHALYCAAAAACRPRFAGWPFRRRRIERSRQAGFARRWRRKHGRAESQNDAQEIQYLGRDAGHRQHL